MFTVCAVLSHPALRYLMDSWLLAVELDFISNQEKESWLWPNDDDACEVRAPPFPKETSTFILENIIYLYLNRSVVGSCAICRRGDVFNYLLFLFRFMNSNSASRSKTLTLFLCIGKLPNHVETAHILFYL